MATDREIGLPECLQRDLDAFREGVRTKSTLDIAVILAEVPYLNELQREFYRVYLEARRVALLS